MRSICHAHVKVLGLHVAGRWEVRIGLRGSKHVYLGLHSSEVEAARVYDRALVLLTGSSAATNFPVSNYNKELEAYQKCAMCPFTPIGFNFFPCTNGTHGAQNVTARAMGLCLESLLVNCRVMRH